MPNAKKAQLRDYALAKRGSRETILVQKFEKSSEALTDADELGGQRML